MVRIAGQVYISAPIEEVFDVVADSRNEPHYNPAMTAVELLTPEPIGLGTSFRAHLGQSGTRMLVEITEFRRPLRLGSRTTSALMDTAGGLTFAASGPGTVMSWNWQVQPKGWYRALGPVFGGLGGRFERKIWNGLKDYLEHERRPAG